MPINPIHAALLHTNKILILSGSGNFTVTCYKWDNTSATPGWVPYSGCTGATFSMGDQVQISATYTFNTSASLLLPVPSIPMTESATVTIQ